jgi:hypothetical protein
MIAKNFPPNPVLTSMEYDRGDLKITFKKGQVRIYENVPTDIAHALYYKARATEALSYYSNSIKGQYTVKQVINI